MNAIALVLAAGRASRFGSDKLATLLEGRPLLAHAVDAALAAPVQQVFVLVRSARREELWAADPRITTLPIHSDSLSDSLRAGIAAAGDASHAFVFLGDMPRVPHSIAPLLAARIGAAYAAMPRHAGRAGHPVLLSAASFADIADLTGDTGAGRLLRARSDVVMVDVNTPGIHLDIDRPSDLPGI